MKADFEELYQRFFKDVYLFVLSMSRDPHTAEEVTQETFFRALKRCGILEATAPSHPGCARSPEISIWTSSGKTGACCRKAMWKKALLPGSPPSSDVAETCIQKEDALSIYRILHCLDEPYKEVFQLRIFGELPFSQIGMIFGKTETGHG